MTRIRSYHSHMVAEHGNGPRRGDRGRESRGVDRNRQDEDEIEKRMGSDVDRAERRHDETEVEINDENGLDNHGNKIEASKMHIIEYEIHQIQYQEVVRHVTVPQIMTQEVLRQVPVPQPFVQTVEETFEVPQVQYSDRIFDLPVVMQCRVPTIQPVQEAVDMPQVQFRDRVRRRIIEETDVPVPRVMEEITEVVQHGPLEQVQNCTGEHAVDVPVRVIKMNLAKKDLEMLAENCRKEGRLREVL